MGRVRAKALQRRVIAKHGQFNQMPVFALIQIAIDLPEQDASGSAAASLPQILIIRKNLGILLRLRLGAKRDEHDMNQPEA